jgi:cobalt-zinc-cadmium efflux system protein
MHARASGADARRQSKNRLLWALGAVGLYFVVELVGGLLTNSLALLSDAGHMLTDVLGLGMAVAAIHAADRARSNPQRTFGLYRLEILAALANAVLLFGVAIYVLYEAIRRLAEPPEVLGLPMLVVAVVGLAVNLAVLLLLRGGSGESLNVEGAYLEVLADLLGSIGVIVAAIVVQTTGFRLIDPLFGVLIGLFVLPRTWRLGRKALQILLQVAPSHLEVPEVRAALCGLEGVAEVHDLHVWTLTSGLDLCTVHLRLHGSAGHAPVLASAQELLKRQFGIDHSTIQIEPAEGAECDPGRPCELTSRSG